MVDDDAAVRESLKFALELDGYHVETYACAEALLARCAFPPEGCLVLDYGLPGMDGLSLLKLLRRQRIDLPAVLITTQPKRSLREAANEAAVSIVEKPLLSDALLKMVQCIVERPASAAAASMPGCSS